MPFKYKEPYRHKFPKMKYRITNWHDYNKALKERGNITIWFDDKAIKSWYAKHNGKPGKQKIYSNTAIKTAGVIRLVFHLALRQAEGLMRSLVKLMNIDLNIPDYTTVSRRLRNLPAMLRTINHKQGTHIIIDGSGLSVHGADELYGLEGKKKSQRLSSFTYCY